MFAGVSCYKKSGHHDLYNFRLLCYNLQMSTPCRAKGEPQNVRGARPSRSLGGASRAALPDKDAFGGRPNTARETRALPTHLPAFQKCRVKEGRKISDNRKYFGNISDKQPFSEKISDLFFGRWTCRVRLSETGSSLPSFASLQLIQFVVNPGQSESNRLAGMFLPLAFSL
jgi:hypothetical protein